MLVLKYDSGNDSVALTRKSINNKVQEIVETLRWLHHECDYIVTVSQTDFINNIGVAIREGLIPYDQVRIDIDELNKKIYFDEEGMLTSFWYDITDWDY